MRIIAVDDEILPLRALEDAIRDAVPNAEVTTFNHPTEALEYAERHKIDIAFLDIRMPGMDGITLAKKLKEIHSRINIIFVSGYTEYYPSAFDIHASGYVMKPIKTEMILKELENLRIPVKLHSNRIRIKCFPCFEVYVNDEVVTFPRRKCKEALAYLIHRQGLPVPRKEIAGALWPDEEYKRKQQSQLQNILWYMMKALRAADADRIVEKRSGDWYFMPTEAECDYISFLKGDAWAVNSFEGIYMSGYQWADISAVSTDILNNNENNQDFCKHENPGCHV